MRATPLGSATQQRNNEALRQDNGKQIGQSAAEERKWKRAAGIEPASSAWKAEVLPLN